MLHSQQRPRALREVTPLVSAPPALDALIFRALEKDRSQSFRTARELVQALERIAPGLPDVGGEPLPLPAVADLTDEATHVTPKHEQDAETVLTTEQPARSNDRELFVVPAVPEPADVQPGSRARWIAPVAAALVVI